MQEAGYNVGLARNHTFCHSALTTPSTTFRALSPCRASNRSTTSKMDASGRIALPAEARQRNRIAEGDTVIITEDAQGLHIKTRDKVLSEAQAYFAKLAPANCQPFRRDPQRPPQRGRA
jgi:AbrB family looped-hinge helix DNA binding protein